MTDSNEASRLPGDDITLDEGEWELAARCGFGLDRWRQIRHRAKLIGADPFDLALADGLLREEVFVTALAERLDVPFTPDPPPPPAGLPAVEGWQMRSYGVFGGSGRSRIIAPGGAIARMLMRQKRDGKLPAILLTTRQRLLERLVTADADRITERATHSLPEAYSARAKAGHPNTDALRRFGIALLTGSVVFVVLALFYPLPALVLPPLVLAPLFIIAGLAALTATLESGAPPLPAPPVETAALPSYTLLIPLYREASVVPKLIGHLNSLLYPRDRIEAFFLVEADDTETRQALAEARLEPWMHVFPVPEGHPRTKPRALNAALPFARGDLLVVYDAEDKPEQDQLLRAAALFQALPENVACLQGRLSISNAGDGFLTRRFAIDYAALFDCIKAGMGRSEWAVPLGGSSNHFRTALLRRVGAWDAWNVTEDADLGLRLARFGWRVEDLRSTTWEEAPNSFRGWMNQRTRWMKGWLQTLVVHSRQMDQTLAALGLFRTIIIAALGGATLVGALLYPLFGLGVLIRLVHPTALGSGPPLLILADAMLVLALSIAMLVDIVPALIALRRRQALSLAPLILATPITHLMVSWAAWRAIYELLRRPYHWHKTTHGLARKEGGLSSLQAPGSRKKA